MITDRNKLNFVTIQWLWFLCLILACSSSTWIQNVDATQQQQQQQQQKLLQHHPHQQQQQQLKSTLQLQQEVESNGPIQKQQHQHQQQQQQQQQDVTVRNFSPRMDYNNNEWRPVGRGDPLKNDPTFDYSPPTLDRVRYWADPDKEKTEEVAAALVDAKLKKANPGKNEILLLGVTGDRDRVRGAAALQHPTGSLLKNSKGETPLLQPKYTSIRRSYYAHQPPTHLMPPPMQPMQPGTQQHQLQASSSSSSSAAHMAKPMHTEYQQQLQSAPSHMIKPVHTEYRHNMPGHSYMTSSPLSSMSMYSKPHYMSTATQPWMHTSSSPSMTSAVHSGHMMSGNSQRFSHPHDSHYQESQNYFSYNTRPSMTSTPSIMMMNGAGGGHHDIYSPNSIRGSSGLHKPSTSSRKPWIHDLLQKEFIKPVKPTMGPHHSYHSETIKPAPHRESHFEPMLAPKGISTTYSPVTFVTPTMPTSTTQTVYITSTSTYQTSTPTTSSTTTTTTTAQPYSHYPSYSTPAPRTSSTFSPTRLLIPNTSNLAYRPTVAPMKMTTDSLFSHYNQPETPLRGPMYLIIEGHSKVKTYGKDELDPHKPKIVPIIPKREPVVRIADPNEKRGTPETFQVKHLHTKTTPIMETTTTQPTTTTSTTTTTVRSTTTKATTTTTKKPQVKTTVKPTNSTAKPTLKVSTTTTTTTTTAKPATTKMAPKLSVTTTTKSKTEKTTANKEKLAANKDFKTPSKGEKSAVDTKMSSNNPNALDTPQKPSQALISEPPTGMDGFLSFLGSSLDTIFKDEPFAPADSATTPTIEQEKKETTTKLKPIQMNSSQPQIEARVSTKLEAIKAEDYDDEPLFKVTTEYLPRETRQIFDYDQLPESRIEGKESSNYDDFLEQLNDEDDDDLSTFNLDDEYEEEDEEGQQGVKNNQHNLIKRIDSLVSSSEDDFDDMSAFEDIAADDLEAFAEARQQHAKKA